MYLTYKFRVKDKHTSRLNKMAGAVNFVWNCMNEISYRSITYNNKWLSAYDLQKLGRGCNKDLGIECTAMHVICEKYALNRRQFKKIKLSWRSKKRSLGWVPFKGCAIKLNGDKVIYTGIEISFIASRIITGKIRCGSFSQDSKGKWYINLTYQVPTINRNESKRMVGIDLGLKALATTSDGQIISPPSRYKSLEKKLSASQRAKKKRLTKSISQKIKNCRKDDLHKISTQLVNQYDQIFVGDVSPSKLKRTRMAKSVSDAGWGMFKSMLAYKAIRLGVGYREINEKFSTVTCSACFERTGPSGLSALGVREWICKCGASHNRDVNAAINILRFGHESQIKGAA